jgi:hypothetical protein
VLFAVLVPRAWALSLWAAANWARAGKPLELMLSPLRAYGYVSSVWILRSGRGICYGCGLDTCRILLCHLIRNAEMTLMD